MISQASFFWSSQLEIAFRTCSTCRQTVEKPKVIIPCGHIVCSKCSGRRSWCPNCSRSIIEVRHEYKSLEFITKVAERLRNPTTSLFQNFPPSGDDANDIELPEITGIEPNRTLKEQPDELDKDGENVTIKTRQKTNKSKKPHPEKSVANHCPAENSEHRVNSSELEWNGICNTIQSKECVESSANSNKVLNNCIRNVDVTIESAEVQSKSVKTKKKQTKQPNSRKKKEKDNEPFNKSLEMRMLQIRLSELKDHNVNKLDIAGCSKFVDGLTRKRYYSKKDNKESDDSIVLPGRRTRSNRSFDIVNHSKNIGLNVSVASTLISPTQKNTRNRTSPRKKIISKDAPVSFGSISTDARKKCVVLENLRNISRKQIRENEATSELEDAVIKLEDEELEFHGFDDSSTLLSERHRYLLKECSVFKTKVVDVERDKSIGESAYDPTETISIRSLGSCSTVAMSDAETEPEPSLDTTEVTEDSSTVAMRDAETEPEPSLDTAEVTEDCSTVAMRDAETEPEPSLDTAEVTKDCSTVAMRDAETVLKPSLDTAEVTEDCSTVAMSDAETEPEPSLDTAEVTEDCSTVAMRDPETMLEPSLDTAKVTEDCSTVAMSDAETEPEPSLDTAEVTEDTKENVIVDNSPKEMRESGEGGDSGSIEPSAPVEEEYDSMLYTPGPKCKKRFLRRTSSELTVRSPKRVKVDCDKELRGFSETDIFTQSVKVLLFNMKLAAHPLLKGDDTLLKSSSFTFGDKQLEMRSIKDTDFSSRTPTVTPGIRAISPVTATERRRANASALMDQSSLEIPSSTPLDRGRSSASSRRQLTFSSPIKKNNNKQPARRRLIKIPDNNELCIIQDDSSSSLEDIVNTSNSDGDQHTAEIEMINNGDELMIPDGDPTMGQVLNIAGDNDVEIVGVYDGDRELMNRRLPGFLANSNQVQLWRRPSDITDKRPEMRTDKDLQPKEGSICTNAIISGNNAQVACFLPAIQKADNQGRQSGRLSFATCCLSEEQTTRVGQLARFSRSELHKDFSHETTHLVIGPGGAKTVEYHLAIAYRAYIVTMAWVDQCISRNRILPTTGYIPRENGGPSRSLEPVPPPFVGISICPKIGNSFDVEYPLFEIIKTLCSLGGATLVTDVRDFGKSSENHTLPFPRLFVYNLDSQLTLAVLDECRRYRAIPVQHKWVFDSISAYTTLPLKNYMGFEEGTNVLIRQYKIPNNLAMSPSKFKLPKSKRMGHHILIPKKSRKDTAFHKKSKKGARRKN